MGLGQPVRDALEQLAELGRTTSFGIQVRIGSSAEARSSRITSATVASPAIAGASSSDCTSWLTMAGSLSLAMKPSSRAPGPGRAPGPAGRSSGSRGAPRPRYESRAR